LYVSAVYLLPVSDDSQPFSAVSTAVLSQSQSCYDIFLVITLCIRHYSIYHILQGEMYFFIARDLAMWFISLLVYWSKIYTG